MGLLDVYFRMRIGLTKKSKESSRRIGGFLQKGCLYNAIKRHRALPHRLIYSFRHHYPRPSPRPREIDRECQSS